jgi:hypothetical protein
MDNQNTSVVQSSNTNARQSELYCGNDTGLRSDFAYYNEYLTYKLKGEDETIVRLNDGTYRGQVVNGVPCGLGEMLFSNGARIEGRFRNGLRNGWSRLTSPGGTILMGMYIDGKLNGTARLRTHGLPNQNSPQPPMYNSIGNYTNGKKDGLFSVYIGDRIYHLANNDGKMIN